MVSWVLALAESMQMLHAANVVHCDFSPRNMLLDQDLEVKVADFGCVSIDGSRTSGGGSVRFYLPGLNDRELIQCDEDLFALGSCIYEVLTGKPPYHDLGTRQIQDLYSLQQFPDILGLAMRDIIRDCWLFRAQSAQIIYERIQGFIQMQV